MTESLDNKYRPKKLSEMIGQPSVITTIGNSIESGNLHHSYLFWGQFGSGKCVVPDTLILTAKGLRRISSLIPAEQGWHDINLSVIDERGKGTSHKGYCEKDVKTIKITTRDGFSLEGTPEHPVKVFDKNSLSIVWKKLEEIKDGDFLAIYRKPMKEDKNDSCPQKWNFDVEKYMDKKFGNNKYIECRICNKKFGNLSSHLHLHGISSDDYKKKYGLSRITCSKTLKSNFLKGCSKDVIIPKEFNVELARLFGYIVSEGGYYEKMNMFSITNSDIQVLSDIEKIMKNNFNINCTRTRNLRTKNTVTISINSVKINEFLRCCGLGQLSAKKTIPDIVLSWPNILIREFLSAYFEGDGGLEKTGTVSCCSISKKLICEIQTILLSMGIISSWREVRKRATNTINKKYCNAYVLSIYGKDVHEFQKKIDFISDTKKQRLRNITGKKIEFNPNKDIVPFLQDELVRIKKKIGVLKNGYLNINGIGVAQVPWPNNIRHYIVTHKNVTYNNIKECIIYFEKIIDLFDKYNGNKEIRLEVEKILIKCREIVDFNYFFSPVVSISEGKNDVFDICKDGDDRSFVANGIVNHNTTMSRLLAAMINCVKGPTVSPCGECIQCKAIFACQHPDVIEMDAASGGKIDEVRDMKKTIYYAPVFGARKKFYIFEEIHGFSKDAEESLLRVIEEPPPHVIFCLTTTEIHKIKHTVVSRCQTHGFQKIYWTQLAQHLTNISKKEKIDIDESAIRICSLLADGSVRTALQNLDKLSSFCGKRKIIEEDAKKLFGTIGTDIYYKLMSCIIGENGKPSMAEGYRIINNLLNENINIKSFLQGIEEHLRCLFIYLTAPQATDLLILSDEERGRLSAESSRFDMIKVQGMISLLDEIPRLLELNWSIERALDCWFGKSVIWCHIPETRDFIKNLKTIGF